MTKYLTLTFIIGFLLINFSATAQKKGKWQKLGSRVVNYAVDRDVIPVGAQEGNYTKLRIVVKGGAINMHRMTVHFGNGTSQDIELRHNFSRRSVSREIDLIGNERKIKTIEFIYDTKNLARSRAIVTVFGRR